MQVDEGFELMQTGAAVSATSLPLSLALQPRAALPDSALFYEKQIKVHVT